MSPVSPFCYRVTARRHFVEDIGEVVTYGIAIDGPNGCCVDDISADGEAVSALCARLRNGDLSPLHLSDAVSDWLNDC